MCKLTSPFWLWFSLSSLMFLSRKSCECLWYSACSSRSYGWKNKICKFVKTNYQIRQICLHTCLPAITTATHTDEVVSVVIFFGCKVIQICRVLVLQRQRNTKVKGQSYSTDLTEVAGVYACCSPGGCKEKILVPWCSPISSKLLPPPPWAHPASPGDQCWLGSWPHTHTEMSKMCISHKWINCNTCSPDWGCVTHLVLALFQSVVSFANCFLFLRISGKSS